MSVDFYGSTITLGGTSVAGSVAGKITGFAIPGDEVKERDDTGLGDTREVFSAMAIKVAQEFEFTVRYDTESRPVSVNDSGSWVITLAVQTSGNLTQNDYTFTGFCKTAGPVSGDTGTSEGVTQTFTVRLTSEITETLET